MLVQITEAMLSARTTLQAEYSKLHKVLLKIVRHDPVCRQFMTVPGVGAVVAITFKTAAAAQEIEGLSDHEAYHGRQDYRLARAFAVNPLRFRRKRCAALGGVTAWRGQAAGLHAMNADIRLERRTSSLLEQGVD